MAELQNSHCGVSVCKSRVSDFIFIDDDVILAEPQEVLMLALKVLLEVKSLVFQLSWAKTKAQVFGGLLDGTVQSVHICGEIKSYRISQASAM